MLQDIHAANARLSEGSSADAAIYKAVLAELHELAGTLIDIGCGTGNLYRATRWFNHYIGVDIVRYAGFPDDATFVQADLNDSIQLPNNCGDVVVSVETIEHLENPRQLLREMRRLVKPDGMIIVTTPNQLSLLSLATLIVKHRFGHFQDCHYPTHITALLESDLIRIARECGLTPTIRYSRSGRLVFTAKCYPRVLSLWFPRACSDNVLMIAKPDSPAVDPPIRFGPVNCGQL